MTEMDDAALRHLREAQAARDAQITEIDELLRPEALHARYHRDPEFHAKVHAVVNEMRRRDRRPPTVEQVLMIVTLLEFVDEQTHRLWSNDVTPKRGTVL